MRQIFLRRTQEEKLDERELPYLILVLGAFGLFMGFMVVATLHEKLWIRKGSPKRP